MSELIKKLQVALLVVTVAAYQRTSVPAYQRTSLETDYQRKRAAVRAVGDVVSLEED